MIALLAPVLALAASPLPPSPFDEPPVTALAAAEKKLRGCIVTGPAQPDLGAAARATRLRCSKQYVTVLDLRTAGLAPDDEAGRKAVQRDLDTEIVRLIANSTGLTS